ncbi:MAG: DUF3102 domain-containing protein [Thermosynechococcaceae cyanobacterium]
MGNSVVFRSTPLSMSDLKPLPLFDYATLDLATSEFLRSSAAEVKALMRQTVENIIRTGNILIDVKNRLPHGQWMIWVESEFGWTHRTAHRMLNVAENFSIENLSNLDIATSALYILSSPSTPEEAREEAIFLAQQGLKITQAAAQELRERHIDRAGGSKTKKQPLIEPQSTAQQLLDLEPPPLQQPLITPPPNDFQPDDKNVELKDEPKATLAKRERLKKSPEQQKPTPIIDTSLITSKAKTVEAGQTWRLGGFHILYCGEPTDPKFIKRLTRNVSLLLEFPLSYDPLPKAFVSNFQSHLAFNTSLHNDFDLGVIREIVETTIEGTTDGGDGVVLYFLPDPAIFLLLDQLECITYCAEPDPVRCNMAIAAWTTVTKRAASRI